MGSPRLHRGNRTLSITVAVADYRRSVAVSPAHRLQSRPMCKCLLPMCQGTRPRDPHLYLENHGKLVPAGKSLHRQGIPLAIGNFTYRTSSGVCS